MEKMNNSDVNELKKRYEEERKEYDNLLTKIDRLKDKLYELTTDYDSEKEKKRKNYFNKYSFGMIVGIFTLGMTIYHIIGDFSFLESMAASFMTILLTCDGIFVLSNNAAEKSLIHDVSLNMTRQTINQCKNYLQQLLNDKEIVMNKRDAAWNEYNMSIGNNIGLMEELNNPLELKGDIPTNNSSKKLVRRPQDNKI